MTPPRQAAAPSFSAREFRGALGMFATGVTIVTARTPEGALIGLTANSFNSVSLDPPLVLWSLARAAGSMAAFSTGSHYAINILAANQKTLAERFARRGEDRFAGVDWAPGTGGAPLLDGAAAHFECFNRSRYEEGDHVIFVGEVERCAHNPRSTPLLFHGGKFYTEHPLVAADTSAPAAPDERFVGGYLGYLLGQASHAVYRDFESAVSERGLTHIAWRVLALLHDAQVAAGTRKGPGVPIGQLAREVLAKQPTVTKLVQRMSDDGLVAIHADPSDQRRTLVAPTTAGLRAARALIEEARAQEERHLGQWAAGEVDTLKRMLARLAREAP